MSTEHGDKILIENSEFSLERRSDSDQENSMALFARLAETGVDASTLEKFLSFKEQWEESERRKQELAAQTAYNAAMAKCQADIQPVVATMKNTQTNSVYADLCAIDEAIRPVYTQHGFALSAGTQRSELPEHIYVYVDVLHQVGHVKRYGDDYPLDSAGIKGTVNKTPIQAKASTESYARRYITMGIFNIAIRRLDKDGNAPKNLAQISTADFNDLKARWAASNPIGDRSREQHAQAFLAWANESVGTEGLTLDYRDWTMEWLETCLKALEHGTAN